MRETRLRKLTKEDLEDLKIITEYLESGMYEQDHNTVLKGTREEALKNLEALIAKNRARQSK